MKRFFLFLCLGVFIVAGLNPASVFAGKKLYVDQNRSQARDRNPGTEQLPWRTIQQAADGANPGDVLVVKPGAYDELLLFRQVSPQVIDSLCRHDNCII